MMRLRLAVNCATGTPRNPSFAPSATISTRTSPASAAIEAAKRVGGRLSRHAGIHHFVRESCPAHHPMQQRWVRGSTSDAVAGGQAVAETNDAAHGAEGLGDRSSTPARQSRVDRDARG